MTGPRLVRDLADPGAEIDFSAEGRFDDPVGVAIRATRVSIVVSDALLPDNPLVFANDAFLQLTGYAREEVIGRNCRFLQGPETDAAAVTQIRRAVKGGVDNVVELLNYRRDGSAFWNALNISPVRNAEGRVHYFFGSQYDVTEKRNVEVELKRMKASLETAVESRTRDLTAVLDQRTVLLHEVDHRVKNNLQLISSLMLLQSRRTQDPAVADALRRMQERLNALSTVHRRLFQADDASRFNLADFISDLAGDLSGGSGATRATVELSLESVDTPASQAAPIALLLGEIVANALHHAFPPGRPGRVRISLRRTEGGCRVEVEDDGIGMSGRPAGFGMTIIGLLSRQLGTTVSYEGDAGVKATIVLPIASPSGSTG